MVRKTRRKKDRKMKGGTGRGRTLKVYKSKNGNSNRSIDPQPPSRQIYQNKRRNHLHSFSANTPFSRLNQHRPPSNSPFVRSPLTQNRTLVDTQELIGVIHQLQSLQIFLDQEIRSIESSQHSSDDLLSLLREKQRISIQIQDITYRLKRLVPEINTRLRT